MYILTHYSKEYESCTILYTLLKLEEDHGGT